MHTYIHTYMFQGIILTPGVLGSLDSVLYSCQDCADRVQGTMECGALATGGASVECGYQAVDLWD